ncbi:MAG: TonB-dependent receptor [Sphingomonadaceae bacterium]
MPRHSLRLAGLVSAAALAQGALAQDIERSSGIDEIIVTAQKRSESVQDVPIAITALSADQLAKQQIRRAEDLITSVPSFQVNSVLGDGIPIFSLRGISMSDFSLAQNGPIAVYYDEVYKGNAAILGLGLFDLERVEVLKGPQGTLYGRNTTGGAVNFISRKPGFETGGNLTLGYGRFNQFTADGAAQTPLTENIAMRLAFTFDRAQGWQKNNFPGGHDASQVRQYGIRGSVRFQNDTIDLTVRGSTSLQNPWNYGSIAIPGPEGVGGPVYNAFGLPGAFRTGLDKREVNTPDIYRRNIRTYALAANADIELSDVLTLTSITSWDRGTVLNPEDGDGTPLKITGATYYGRTKQITQDLRLTSDFNGDFDFILGGYFSNEKIHNSTDTNFFTDIDVNGDGNIDAADCIDGGGFISCNILNRFNQKKTSLAVYSDATYDFLETFTLRAGLRYTHDRGKLRDFIAQTRAVDLTPIWNNIPGSDTDLFATTSRDFKNDNVSGRIGIDYKPVDKVLLYANYSRGYRSAAFSGQAFFSPGELTVAKPEKLEALEGGFKTEFFDRRVRLNGSVYRYNYKNQQFIDVDPATTEAALINLPKARITGAELDLNVVPVQNLTLTTAVGLLDTKVLEGSAQGVDVKGNRLISAPKFTLSASAEWSAPLGTWGRADTRIDLAHASGQYFDILNRRNTFDDGYTLLNGRIRIYPEHDRFGLAFWVKNLTNAYYYTNMIDASVLGYTYTHINPPRTFGVTVDMSF